MQEIISHSGLCYHTDFLMVLCAVMCLMISSINSYKFRFLKFFFVYPLASILQSICLYMSVYYNLSDDVVQASISIFVLVEFLLIYKVMFKVISIPIFRKMLQAIYFCFLAYLICMWAVTDIFLNTPAKVFLVQSLCMLIPIFFYFLQLFKLPPDFNLTNKPEFWIALGCLFYFSSTIPLFLVKSLISTSNHYLLNSINFIGYSILYSCISRAFLCKKVQLI